MQGDGHQLHASQDLSVTLIESTQSVTDQPQSKAVLLAIKALQDEVNRLEREMNEGRQREMKLAERLACVEAYWTEKLEQELIKNDGQSRELRRLEDYNRQLMAITDQLKTEKSSIQRDLTIKLESVTSENKELKAVIGQLTDKLAHAEKQAIADLKSHRQFKDKMQKEHQSEVDDLRKTLLMATEQLATTKQIVERQAKDQRLALDSLNKKIEKKENSFLKEIEALKLQIFELTNESNSTISSLKSKSKKDKEKINQLKLQLKGLLVSNSQEKESLVQELESAQATMIKTNKSVQRLNEQLESKEVECSDLLKSKTDLESQLSNFEDYARQVSLKNEEMQANVESLFEKVRHKEEQIRLLQAVIIEKDRDIEVKINSGEKLQSKLEGQEIAIRKLETDLKVSGDVNDQLRHQKAEQQEELENLRRTIAELEQMIHESMMRDEAQ